MNIKAFVSYNRRIADRIAPLIARTPLSANAVTLFSLAAGVAAGASFAQGSRIGLCLGSFCLHLSFVLDNCDGQVARIKKQSSEWGMWLDYWSDLLVDLSLWWGLYGGARKAGPPEVEPVYFGLAAVASLGSLVNFVRVVSFRRTSPKPMVVVVPAEPVGPGASGWRAAWEALGDDGDPSVLVWVLALLGRPDIFLVLGTVYVNLLWMFGPKPADERSA